MKAINLHASSGRIWLEQVRGLIRDIPDFPKPGIVFKDITPLLNDPAAFQFAIDEMLKKLSGLKITKVVAIESRGFLFGSPLAYRLGAGLTIVRKPNKLPYQTVCVEYALEYGTDSLEAHVDSMHRDDSVVIVDDVLATGGTARATVELAEKMGAHVEALLFLMELPFLGGRERLNGYRTHSLLTV